jgi:hypothetical protein
MSINLVELVKKGRNRLVKYLGLPVDAETHEPVIPADVTFADLAELADGEIQKVAYYFWIGFNRTKAAEAIDADIFAGVIPADATDYAAGAFRRTVKNQAKFADLAVADVAAMLAPKWNWKKAAPAKKAEKAE